MWEMKGSEGEPHSKLKGEGVERGIVVLAFIGTQI
jgi:hypothetical protein